MSFILGVIALALSCLLPIWTARAVLGGVVTLLQVKNLPTHKSMAEVSQIIWETCKTYLSRSSSRAAPCGTDASGESPEAVSAYRSRIH